ncbi:MAG: 30S ribosome-binding factor RbfA [Oscillospiraceae bacterium]
MPSKKLNRINEDIRLVMSELLREVKDPRIQQGLISVTSAEATGDLKYCKVYISVLGLKSEKELTKGLKSASGWLRRELGQRLKLRNVPELNFYLDHSIEEGAHINKLLSELDIPEDDGDGTDNAE